MKISDFLIKGSSTLKESMKKIDSLGFGVVFVEENSKLIGILTDGDVRRAILSGSSLDDKIIEICNKEPVVLKSKLTEFEAQSFIAMQKKNNKLLAFGTLKVPVVDDKGSLADVLVVSESKIISLNEVSEKPLSNNSVKNVLVIGGAGY